MADDFTPPVDASTQQYASVADNSQQPSIPMPTANPFPTPTVPPADVPKAINVFNPDGNLVSIPHSQLNDAVNNGYSVAPEDKVHEHFNEEKYGGTLNQIATGAEAFGRGVAGPLATAAEMAAGVDPEGIRGREEANPKSAMLGEGIGLVGGLATGVGEAALAEKIAAKGVEHALPAGSSVINKIGSAATKGAIENMIIQGSDETSKLLTQDPEQSIGTAAADIGLSGLIGGALTGGIAGVSPLWKATVGPKVGQFLDGIARRAGGIDGQLPDVINDAITRSGVELSPEIKAGLSDNPTLQQAFQTLNQSDTTSSGQALQAAVKKFKNDSGEALVNTLGKSMKELDAMPEINNYERGKEIAHTLADEYHAQIDPISKEFEDLKAKYKDTPLPRDEVIQGQYGIPAQNTYGTASKIADRVSELVSEQAWHGSPEIMKEVDRILKQLPRMEKLKDLTDLSTAVGNNTASSLPFGQQTPLSRAGSMIKGILRDAESDVAELRLGEKAPDLVERYKNARAAYSSQGKLKDALDDRLGIRGSIGGFAKGLKEAGNTDGEAIIRKLSGKNDADLLKTLEQRYPKTAAMLRTYHTDQLLSRSVNKAKEGYNINANEFLKSMNNMDPNLRNFVIPAEAQTRAGSVGTLLSKLDGIPNHNFSNTARTVDKLFEHLPGSAMGLASMLSGHGIVGSTIIGGLTKLLSKDAPDAIRLAMLKYLGSGKEISAPGFKALVDTLHNTIRGENLVAAATKNVFKAGREVLPKAAMPTESDRKKLDKQLKQMKDNPSSALDIDKDSGHYAPEHQEAKSKVAMNAANYLNALRPSESRASPLDSKPTPNPVAEAKFKNALNIAQQPLIVIDKLQKGTLTPDDLTHLKAIYPKSYNDYLNRLTANMGEALSKGQIIPYKTRVGLSQMMTQPMDSTFTPAGIMGAQPAAQQTPGAQQQNQGPVQGGGKSVKALGKTNESYRTAGQQREQSRANAKD